MGASERGRPDRRIGAREPSGASGMRGAHISHSSVQPGGQLRKAAGWPTDQEAARRRERFVRAPLPAHLHALLPVETSLGDVDCGDAVRYMCVHAGSQLPGRMESHGYGPATRLTCPDGTIPPGAADIRQNHHEDRLTVSRPGRISPGSMAAGSGQGQFRSGPDRRGEGTRADPEAVPVDAREPAFPAPGHTVPGGGSRRQLVPRRRRGATGTRCRTRGCVRGQPHGASCPDRP